MTNAVADLSELLEGVPAGAWVAISESQHRVMSFGPDAQAVLAQSQQRGEPNPLIVRVPDHATAMFL